MNVNRTFLAIMIMTAIPAFSQFWLDNTEGISAEALGRGGASIAVADDAAGVWWNPAGLARIKKSEAVLGLDSFRQEWEPHEDVWSRSRPTGPITGLTHTPDGIITAHIYTLDERFEADLSGLGYVAAARPFHLGDLRAAVWVGYRRMMGFPDMEKRWTKLIEEVETGSQHLVYFSVNDDYSGGLEDWGAAFAVQAHPRLGIGLHLHYLRADAGRDSVETILLNDIPYNDIPIYRYSGMTYEFDGLLWDLGLQYEIGKGLRLGAVYRSGMDAGMDYTWMYPAPRPGEGDLLSGHTRVHWPSGWGLGAAWEAAPSLLLALDYTRTEWSEAVIDESDEFGGTYLRDVGFPSFAYGQEDSNTWRVGMEYAFSKGASPAWTLRAGYVRMEQMLNALNTGRMVLKYPYRGQPVWNGITLGAGTAWKALKLDAAYLHMWWEDDFSYNEGDLEGSAHASTDRFLLSATLALE